MGANPAGVATRGFQPRASPASIISRGLQARASSSTLPGTITIAGFDYFVYGALVDSPDSPPNPVDVIGVDHYFAGSYQKSVAWAAAGNTDARGRLLVDATRALDRFPWAGAKTDAAQPLAWPRTGVTRADGTAVGSTLFPLEVVLATYEMAYIILQDPDQASTPAGTASNVKSVQAGRAKVEFFQPQPGVFVASSVWDLIGPFLSTGTASSTLVVAHGTSSDSSFDCPGDYFQLRRLV